MLIGRDHALSLIESYLSDSNESGMVNLIGGYGSGRTALLAEIQDRIQSREIKFDEEGGDPIVCVVQGRTFKKSGNLLEFFSENILPYFDDVPSVGEDLDAGALLEETLNEYTLRRDIPIIIMIDGFTRILERIQYFEAQNLNRFRPPGVRFILVTDYRPIEEIAPQAYEYSDFLRAARPVQIEPLNRLQSIELLSYINLQKNDGGEGALGGDILEVIAQVAGGSPALLTNVYETFSRQLRKNDGNHDIVTSKFKHGILDFLPEEALVKYHLSRLMAAVRKLSLTEQHLLLQVASEDPDASLRPDIHSKFLDMGLFRDRSLNFNGKLMQFSILNEIMPAPFSRLEEILWALFYDARPGLVRFQAMHDVIVKNEQEQLSEQSIRRRIDSTMLRIRKKVNEMPNHAAFAIENERGLGYVIRALVSFGDFLEKGPSVFKT